MITLKPNLFYVYKHLVPNTANVFYIGVGKSQRPFETRKSGRSVRWLEQYKKTGFTVEIVGEFDSKKDALDTEVLEINKAKNAGYDLVNETGGGLGMLGIKPWNAGINRPFSEDSLIKISEAGKRRFSDRNNRIEHSIKCGGGKLFMAETLHAAMISYLGRSQKECADLLGLRQGCISRCLSGKSKTHKGYRFKYVK